MAACRESLATCENPEFPNWMWRYNRNKRLSRFEPWYTRLERWPPQYRNMGMHDNFRFHPVGPNEQERPFLHLGVNYAHDLLLDRKGGFGNSALGFTPGPAPPRLVVYEVDNPYPRDDLYKVNEIHNLSPGMSLLDHTYLPFPETDYTREPLNPRQYLEKTLGQAMELPGTFPHFNVPSSGATGRLCGAATCGSIDPMEVWLDKHSKREAEQALERYLRSRPQRLPMMLEGCSFEDRPVPDFEDMRAPIYKVGVHQCAMAPRKIY